MEYRDVSAEIESVSRDYASHKLPAWVVHWQEVLQQCLLRLQEFLNNLFQHRGPGPSDSAPLSSLLQYALYLAGIIALIVICVLLFQRVLVFRRQKAASRRGAAAVEKILDSQGYRHDAERLAALGDFKGACRALYLCLLQHMHEEKVAAFAPAKTNFEYRYLLVSFPNLQSVFIQLADLVEQSWFGNKNALGDDYSQCRQLLLQADEEVEHIRSEKARQKVDADT